MFLICKPWLLGKDSVHFLTLGQNWNSLLPFISYQFYAFFSYFYTLRHKTLLIIRKHWFAFAGRTYIFNTKWMKVGYNRIYQRSNVSFGRVSCTASIHAPQASFMVQFPVVTWGLHRDGIIMVSCSAFYGGYMTYYLSYSSIHQKMMVGRTEIVVSTSKCSRKFLH